FFLRTANIFCQFPEFPSRHMVMNTYPCQHHHHLHYGGKVYLAAILCYSCSASLSFSSWAAFFLSASIPFFSVAIASSNCSIVIFVVDSSPMLLQIYFTTAFPFLFP